MMRNRGVNVRVINDSWYGGPFDALLQDAFQRAGNAGILSVTIAGNGDDTNHIGYNIDANPVYPASFKLPSMITVAATDDQDHLTYFSNYGPGTVALAAPGFNIWSTKVDGGYDYFSGTSESAPFVAGTAALVASRFPNTSYQELRDAVIAGIDPIAMPPGKFTRTNGRLNAANALQRFDRDVVVTGQDAGRYPYVRVYFARQAVAAVEKFAFFAYATNFTGGVRVAAGDFNGDGVTDVVTAPGPGRSPLVRIFNGRFDGQVLIRSFDAYASTFTGGVYVAAGDVDGDGVDDLVTGADRGGGPHVEVFRGTDNVLLRQFFAYDPAFTGGVRVAVGDVNGDGHGDVITGAGPGGSPHVRVFSGTDGSIIMQYFAYATNFTGGVYVAAGDINGDGRADIITGAGAGGGPHVRVVSGATGADLANFFAFAPNYAGGVRVAAVDLDGDGRDDLVVSQGSTSPSFPTAHERVYSLLDPANPLLLLDQAPFGPGVGVFVGARKRRF
jgi:hypothetical protein